ncbi:hypothetical protein WV31_12665 [Magnetospirillum sp. ME-1]|uniref:hypothetical protein n=1 Tax=Magnetospirillum sp. ME-1 TaxID=1639348 RepID=UPI000A17CAA0|nr:hypothetical protein [Magnetospirillum sp. ME-1]ARJ66459.1 hypothetical protein WV31_12665 [Magnetospirillum sp. ME-1]
MGNKITTATGRNVNPLDLRPEDIDIRDIAHSLSLTCRFNGHCRVFYSVAEHSVLVSKLCPPKFAFEALMHDAAEAYLGDVPTPLKRQWPEYKEAEDRAHAVIAQHFGLPAEISEVVHDADGEAFGIEEIRLLVPPGQPGDITPLRGLSPEAARQEFVDRFYELYVG